MLKKFFTKNKKRCDIRFLDAESFKNQHALGRDVLRQQSDDSFIKVEKNNIHSAFLDLEAFDSVSFLEVIRQATIYSEVSDNDQGDVVSSNGNLTKTHLNSLGVFSDSKIYSTLIQSVLSSHDLNIEHFNHPNTFKQDKYDFFDEISSWIIFLSDDQDSDFLERFVDRYVDKPTLFLFSKLNKDAFVKRITQFIQQNNLEAFLTYTIEEV
jgi:hypothetical protein